MYLKMQLYVFLHQNIIIKKIILENVKIFYENINKSNKNSMMSLLSLKKVNKQGSYILGIILKSLKLVLQVT